MLEGERAKSIAIYTPREFFLRRRRNEEEGIIGNKNSCGGREAPATMLCFHHKSMKRGEGGRELRNKRAMAKGPIDQRATGAMKI